MVISLELSHDTMLFELLKTFSQHAPETHLTMTVKIERHNVVSLAFIFLNIYRLSNVKYATFFFYSHIGCHGSISLPTWPHGEKFSAVTAVLSQCH